MWEWGILGVGRTGSGAYWEWGVLGVERTVSGAYWQWGVRRVGRTGWDALASHSAVHVVSATVRIAGGNWLLYYNSAIITKPCLSNGF